MKRTAAVVHHPGEVAASADGLKTASKKMTQQERMSYLEVEIEKRMSGQSSVPIIARVESSESSPGMRIVIRNSIGMLIATDRV